MADQFDGKASHKDLVRMSAQIVGAFAGKNSLSSSALTNLIGDVYEALNGISKNTGKAQSLVTSKKPAVPIRRSVSPDYIVCLEDGRKLKMLKRYLRAAFKMTPEEYRDRWGLPRNYPMVAPNYAKKRSDSAKKMGFGKRSN